MKKMTLFMVLLAIVGAMFALTCYDVQYTAESSGTSPYYGETVTVEGIVVATEWKGYVDFFIADPEGGPWHGLFVYDGDEEYGDLVSVGDMVSITGMIDEYYDLTELKNISDMEILSQGNELPPVYRTTTGEVAESEALESVYVYVTGDLEVTAEQNEYGEWYIDDGSGECQVDDGFFYLDSVDPPIVIEFGDVWGTIRGLVDYSYDLFAINPVSPSDIDPNQDNDNEAIEVPQFVVNNYPNPFNPETTINFNLPEAGNTTLEIYNVRGQKITTLINERLNADQHEVTWNGTDESGKNVTSGVYFYKINSGRYTATKKMILLK